MLPLHEKEGKEKTPQYPKFTMSFQRGYGDTEKGPNSTPYDLEKRHGHYIAEDGAVPGETFEYGNSMYAKAQRFAGKLRVEQRGIERVPEDERTDTGFKAHLNVSTMVRNMKTF